MFVLQCKVGCARCPECALFVPNGYRRDGGSLLSVLLRRRLTHRMAVNNQMGRYTASREYKLGTKAAQLRRDTWKERSRIGNRHHSSSTNDRLSICAL